MKHHGCYAVKILTAQGFRYLAGLFFVPFLWGQANVLMWHNDAARSGQNLNETILSPSNVSSTNFGLLPISPLTTDGAVDAQPLYVMAVGIGGGTHNVLYVATENDSVYAFDADTGTQYWKTPLLPGGETAVPDTQVGNTGSGGCSQVAPILGITSTPAVDLSYGTDGTIFVVTMSWNGSTTFHQRLHALDLVTGVEESGWPVNIQATYPSTGPQSSGGVVTFDPKQYKERAALLVSNGIVYTTWASHCDNSPYSGWIIAYKESNQAQIVLNLAPNGEEGAIWQAGAGPAADAGGNLYFLMANGTFDTTLTSGFPQHGDYGNAFMNLSTITGLTVQDYFTMDNTTSESGADEDLGSGGAILLPTLNNAMGNPVALAVGAGKDGNAYVVDRNNMGKYNGSSNAVYQQFEVAPPFSSSGGVYSSPAWFSNTLYYGAVNQPLKAFTYSGGLFGTSASSSSAHTFGYPGATPSISANGSANGIVWAVDSSSSVLYAYNASNLGTELYDSNQAASNRDHFGTSIKFATPTVANGKVYVGTTGGVAVFGLLNCTYALSGSGFSISVTTTSGCSWSTANDSNFIQLIGPTSGTGNGTVNFNLPDNPGSFRQGLLLIGGQIKPIGQIGLTTTNGLAFYTLPPCRIVDTRANSGFEGAFGAPYLSAGTTRNFPVPATFCNVPPTAQAYSVNFGALPHGALGYLTTWPAGSTLPGVGTLGSPSGAQVSNAAVVPAGTDAAISVYASNATDVIIDINGYFGPPNLVQPLAFYPITPCRVADTRASSGFDSNFGPPSLVAATPRSFPIPLSTCGFPDTAAAYSFNIGALPHASLQYLTTYPTGSSLPVVGTLGSPSGTPVSNAALVPAGTSGAINVYASAATDVIIDGDGYFAAPTGSSPELFFYPLTPCRVVDTRSPGSGLTGSFGPPTMSGGATRAFPLQLMTSCNIPDTAQAYSLNIGVVTPGALQYLTVWPQGESMPTVGTLNSPGAGVVSDAAIVPAGTPNGGINVYVSNTTNVIIDINGYFAP